MGKYRCPCCGCRTLEERRGYEICPVCFWEDDIEGADPEQESGANHGLTLRQGRENYRLFGACEEGMLAYVREPNEDEKV